MSDVHAVSSHCQWECCSGTALVNCSPERHEFSSNQVLTFSHAGVGSGTYMCPFPEGSNKEITCLYTSGVLVCRVGWGVDSGVHGGGEGRILAPPEKYWAKGRRLVNLYQVTDYCEMCCLHRTPDVCCFYSKGFTNLKKKPTCHDNPQSLTKLYYWYFATHKNTFPCCI